MRDGEDAVITDSQVDEIYKSNCFDGEHITNFVKQKDIKF